MADLPAKPGHRSEIDGLRAIAVTGVVLDHAGVPGFGAGFAGVDIFFVISGFLIGGIVLKAMAEGSFTFTTFYARRARRILPALFVMILITLPFGLTLMSPQELRYYGGGAFSTLLFLSNVWFLTQVDYFNPGLTIDPLLHTWSLAVEEQFYLLLPVLLIGLLWGMRSMRSVGIVLALLALISFALAVSTPPTQAMAAFYLGHTRAWELLAGVLASMVWLRAHSLPGPLRGGLALLGLLFALGSITVLPTYGRWPGFATLVPVLGAVLVLLFADHSSAAKKILSFTPMVWLGMISYSAYLWHQPLLGFIEVADRPVRDGLDIALFLAVTLVLAWASWRFVEQPFRLQQVPRRTARWVISLAAIAILGFSVGGHISNGYPQRLPLELRTLMDAELQMPPTFRTCIGKRRDFGEITPETACVHGADAAPSVVIWGDSHAGVLVDPLAKLLAPHGLSVRELTLAGCPPVPGLDSPGVGEYAICEDHNRRMFQYLLTDSAIKLVILHAYWNHKVQRIDYDNGAGDIKVDRAYLFKAGSSTDQSDTDRFAELTTVISDEVKALRAAGKQVIIIGPVPDPGFNVLDRIAMRYWKQGGSGAPMTIPAKAALDYGAPTRQILTDAARAGGAQWIDPAPLFCVEGGVCTLTADGKALYFDDNHLALLGVQRLMPRIMAAARVALGDTALSATNLHHRDSR